MIPECVIAFVMNGSPENVQKFALSVECKVLEDVPQAACKVAQVANDKYQAMCINLETREVLYAGPAFRVQEV
jgi:hypothetical protein